MLAFVLIELKECDEVNVLDRLKAIDQVKEAFVVFGEWDILLKVDVENAEDLGKFMIDNVRTIPEVKLSSTMIVAKS